MPKMRDASLGRKVCGFCFGVYASPDYLTNMPDLPLAEQDWVIVEGTQSMLVPLIWRDVDQLERQAVFRSTSGVAACSAAEVGLGLFPTSCYMGDGNAKLVPVTRPIGAMSVELWVLTQSDRRRTARVKALMSYLVERLSRMRDLFEGRKALEYPGALFSADMNPVR